MIYEPGIVYFNPRTAAFTQYRGNGSWGGQCPYWRDAQTVNYNMPPKPWWVELLAVPYPQESEIMTYNGFGWVSLKHWHPEDRRRVHHIGQSWTSYEDFTVPQRWTGQPQ